VLFGDFVGVDGTYFHPNETVEPEKSALRPRRIDELPNASEYRTQARERLEWLTRFTLFSFTDEWDQEHAHGTTTGMTMYTFQEGKAHLPGYVITAIATLTVNQLRDLCQDAPPELSPAEASYSRLHASTTVRIRLLRSLGLLGS